MPTKPASYSPNDGRYDHKGHPDDGYVSQESRACSHNGTMASSRDSYECQVASYESSPTTRADCYHATPSPSDSGVGELEAILREKENELQALRETMEANEKVIFQVSQDVKCRWFRLRVIGQSSGHELE